MRKSLVVFIISFIAFSQSYFLANASEKIKVYFFYGNGCPHCAKEMQFLQNLQKDYSNLDIITYEIYDNKDNALLLKKIGKSLNADVSGVPFSVIGEKYFIGYAEGITSEEIRFKIKECNESKCPDVVANVINSKKQDKLENKQTENNSEKIINLPFFGKIDTYKFSLPMLTVIMGFLDGFNPCAMWTLLFLISLLLGMKDRKRMWILGTAFVVASASVYFLFMSAWLNLILFLGFIASVRIIIGILALSGGGYNLKKFIFNKNSGCEVTNDEKRQKVFQKLKGLVGKNSFWIALGGIISLAFMVNLVELICSAGLPAVYTQVLAINELSRWQHYLYILLYIFFFMLDDLFIFFMAMITLEMTGISTKYSRYSQLVGGIIMIIIGILLIFKPEWLMFG